jgi:protein-arginine kinase activator protein McsA
MGCAESLAVKEDKYICEVCDSQFKAYKPIWMFCEECYEASLQNKRISRLKYRVGTDGIVYDVERIYL